jgi:hypothetical protein
MRSHIRNSLIIRARILLLVGSLLPAVTSWCQVATISQNPQWEILSPLSDSIVDNENLLVSVMLNNFEPSPDAQILLDNTPLPGMLKISGNRISFVYFGFLRDGLHRLTISSPISQLNKTESVSWNFYVNRKDVKPNDKPFAAGQPGHFTLAGSLMADNRSTSLTGKGEALRQEPSYTRSVSLNMVARNGDAEIPVKIFATSDNRYTLQSNNFFQVGFHNKWLEIDAGDLNPNLDRLVLSGVRIRGASLKLKF